VLGSCQAHTERCAADGESPTRTALFRLVDHDDKPEHSLCTHPKRQRPLTFRWGAAGRAVPGVTWGGWWDSKWRTKSLISLRKYKEHLALFPCLFPQSARDFMRPPTATILVRSGCHRNGSSRRI